MENSIEFFLNTHLEWSLSHQDSVITKLTVNEFDNVLGPGQSKRDKRDTTLCDVSANISK